MRIQTSNYRKHGSDKRAVAISATVPPWYKGHRDPRLAPPMSIVRALKDKRITEAEYTEIYRRILDALDARALSREWELQYGPDIIILCWCPEKAFCHRFLVAQWLHTWLNIEITEAPAEVHRWGVLKK